MRGAGASHASPTATAAGAEGPSLIERLLGAPAGSEVERPVDLIVTDDWTTPALERPLEELGTSRPACEVVFVRDHTGPLEGYEGAERERVERLREVEERFCARFASRRLLGEGIQHHVLPRSGLLRPGMLVLGNDSHTPTLGAFGVLALAAQPTSIAAAIHSGIVRLRVPATLRVELTGRLRPGVSARDAAMALLGLLRDGGPVPRLATGKVLEFAGPGVAGLGLAERAILANVAPEAVALTSLFPVDGKAARHLGSEVASAGKEGPPPPGSARAGRGGPEERRGAAKMLTLDLTAVEPAVARSGSTADVLPLAELGAVAVDRVFVGTCAGGTYEEIAAFAAALGPRAAIPALVAPASREVRERLRREGILDRLAAAGVELLEPGCGACFGFGRGRLAEGEVAVTTGNRNSSGRMGPPSSRIYLASGRVAGLAAASGRLGGGAEAGVAPARAPQGTAQRGPVLRWPAGGNVLRLLGIVTTDDLTPSSVPGVGTSSDPDPAVVRRLLLHHLDPAAAERDLRGMVVVADENFGMGSNRASSVRALRLAGIAAVVARSFAPLYEMGARDEALPLLVVTDESFYGRLTPCSRIDIDLAAGRLALDGRSFPVAPLSPYERELREAGGIVPLLRRAAQGASAR